ncbi:hypothetical protein BDN72DRAFT_765690 [Pluteus cervinus]|uniref:Uncharacterized protein n=1 Tax=Pluteus cervinus TaxID=181527 RepID=A0ACD3AZF1_9AGAR|nr:hypothetical protein BDN72DRAFT_765690 [Pluteus cervinus]
MENPSKEIADVVHQICTSLSPDVQKETIERCFTHDAAFDHPLVSVPGGPGSRERLLGVYQWYRVLSPNTKVEVKHTTWDEANKLLWLDVCQTFSPRISPLPGFPADMVVRLSMRKEGNLWCIEHQQDFFEPAVSICGHF